jgi:protein-S-isoprenylcysteine O-methyltransferase Ste14
MTPSTPPGKSPATYAAVTILLAIGIFGTLWVPIYARTTPMWGDFPFFYWYQLIWVPVVAVLSWVCYLLLRTKPASRAAVSPPADGREAK